MNQHTTTPHSHSLTNKCNVKDTYPQLNILKLLCAFLIITIHVPSILFPQITIELISRLAVPIFFIITGFFISSDGREIHPKKVRRSLIKAILFTIVAQGLYLIIQVSTDLYFHNDLSKYDKVFWRNLILLGVSINVPFWYLNALVQTLFVFWILSILKLEKIIPILVVVGLLLNLALGQYSWIFNKNYVSFIHRNFFTIGIPCVGLGYFIKRYEKKLPSKNILISLICLISTLLLLEVIYNSRIDKLNFGDIYLMTIPLACAIFCCLLKIKSKSGLLSYAGMKYSGLIFVLHMLIHESVISTLPHYYIWGPLLYS